MDFLSPLALPFLRFFSLSLFPPLLSPLKRAAVRLFRSRAARHTYALAPDSLWDGGPELQEGTVRQTFFHPEFGGGGAEQWEWPTV